MTRKLPAFLESVLLSLLCAWSGAGCLISAFSLRISGETVIILLWLSWALVCSVLQFRRWGRVALLTVAAAGSFWLWQDGGFGIQLLGTLGTLAKAYDSGYGFGIPEVLQVERTASDLPVLVLGMAQIYAVSRTICRRKGKCLPVALLLLPLAACMVVTDTVPQPQALFGLLLGLCLLLVTDGVRRENGAQANKLFAAAVLPITLALAVLFYCFPRETYVNSTVQLRENILTSLSAFPRSLQQMDFLSGFKRREKVNLSVLPTQLLLGIPVAEVTAEQSGTVYLRAQDYDIYTGTAWESTSGRQDTLAGSGSTRGSVRVELLGSADALLVPAFPNGQVFLLNGRAENEGGAVETFELREFSLAAYPGNQWLTLPEETGSRCRQLIQSAAIGTESVEQTAANVASYVQSRAVYDRTGTAMGENTSDFALWFLEQGERGYCVHFATAATVLLRAAGIPARYVTGYRVDARAGQPVQVTSDDAHAWVEYYNYRTWGWYVLEATPTSLEDLPAPTTAPTEQSATQAVTQPVPVPSTQTPTEPESTEASAQPNRERKQIPLWIPLTLLAAGLASLLAEMQRLVRIELRRKKQQKGSNNQRALSCNREIWILARLARRKVPEELEELTEKAMYSQHTLTAEELRQFAQFQTACRKALRKAPWWKKAAYRYLYAVI